MKSEPSAENVQAISYALAKQVPDIACHAVFETNYGQLQLDCRDSRTVAKLVEQLLRRKLKRAQAGMSLPP
jgi:hypothetical protein